MAQKQLPINQYDFVLIMAAFMRKHPESPLIPKVKACKTQQEAIEIFAAGYRG